MLDYALLRALLAIERERSFEGAARALGITSSAISQRIKLLEQRTGAIIVHRKVPVTPTAFGLLLCRHTEKVMILEESVFKENARHFQSYKISKKSLKILVNDDSLSNWFIDVLQADAKLDDPFLFELEIADQDHSLNEMKAGTAIAAISASKTAIQGFRSSYLGDLIYHATASKAFYDRYFDAGVTVENLQSSPSLRFRAQDDLQNQWVWQTFKSEIILDSHILPSTEGYISACLKDVAWGMNPTHVVDRHLQSGNLVELIQGSALYKPLYWHCSLAVYDQMKSLTDKVMAAAKIHLYQNNKINRP